jgi:hypothetical protein
MADVGGPLIHFWEDESHHEASLAMWGRRLEEDMLQSKVAVEQARSTGVKLCGEEE